MREIGGLTTSPVFHYFFRHEPGLENDLAAYRSILTQIFQHFRNDQDVYDQFVFAMQGSSTGQSTGTKNELTQLLQLFASRLTTHFMILDGIDECTEAENLMSYLTKVAFKSRQKVMLFSRPNVRVLLQKVPHSQRLIIGKSNSSDIRRYLRDRLEDLRTRDCFREDADIEEYVRRLNIGADGMFLWARLMVDYLDSFALTDEDRADAIMDVTTPEELPSMYLRIINQICRRNKAEKELSKWCLMWLAFAKSPLTAAELEESVKLLKTRAKLRPGRIAHFDNAVLLACAGLVEKGTFYDPRHEGLVPCFRFIHSTVQEYLSELVRELQSRLSASDTKEGILTVIPVNPNIEMAEACMQYIHSFMCNQARSGETGRHITPQQLVSDTPLSAYVVKAWSNHLRDAALELGPNDNQRDSFGTKSACALFTAFRALMLHRSFFRFWIEAMYVFRANPNAFASNLGAWSQHLETNLKAQHICCAEHDLSIFIRDSRALSEYIGTLHKHWGPTLTNSPEAIWMYDEISAFTPSRFLSPSSTIVEPISDQSYQSPSEAGKTYSSKHICRVSEVSSDSLLVGCLSVWTSRYVYP